MVKVCSVAGCDKNSLLQQAKCGLIQFHSFPPKDDPLFNKWVHFCNRTDWQPSSKMNKICSLHFMDEDYTSANRLVLLKRACPTLYLDNGLLKTRYELESIFVENDEQRNVVILNKSIIIQENFTGTPTKSVHVKIEHEPKMDIYGLLPVNKNINTNDNDYVVLKENQTRKISEVEENKIKKSMLVVKDNQSGKIFKVKTNENKNGGSFNNTLSQDVAQEKTVSLNNTLSEKVPPHILALRRELRRLQQKVRRQKMEIEHLQKLVEESVKKKRMN